MAPGVRAPTVSQMVALSRPASRALFKTRLRKPLSEREPSSVEISAISPWAFACATASSVMSRTSSFVLSSFVPMWRSEVGMMMLTLSTPASMATSMSLLTPRVALQISASSPSEAMSFTASNSPSEMHAKPASMISTPSWSMPLAIWSFFSGVKEMPGVCSPSRRVVSKNLTCSGKSVNKAIPHFPIPSMWHLPRFMGI